MVTRRREPDVVPERRRAGLGGTAVAPLVAAVIVLLVGVVSLGYLLGSTGSPATGGGGSDGGGGGNGGGGPIGPGRTPNPSVVITPPPEERTEVRGTLLFTRTGNIWAANGFDLRQLSDKGTDSSPAWTRDGSAIYFIETREKRQAKVACSRFEAGCANRFASYTFYAPAVMRMAPDGSARTEIKDGLFRDTESSPSGGEWFTWLLQPDVSPDGSTLALASDGNDGFGDVVLSTMPSDGGRVTDLKVRNSAGLGHSDPAWSPDGTRIAFTYNVRSGSVGLPRIGIYTLADKSLQLVKGGYANPSWSPDGALIAAERTTGRGRDIVVLDVARSSEVVRLTNDGRSFAPIFSPDGKQIAYLHLQGLGVDLRIVTFTQEGGAITFVEDKAITEDGSLDASSPPAWWFPPDLIPEPTAPPATPPSAEPTTAP